MAHRATGKVFTTAIFTTPTNSAAFADKDLRHPSVTKSL
jgi:hypothetical protein